MRVASSSFSVVQSVMQTDARRRRGGHRVGPLGKILPMDFGDPAKDLYFALWDVPGSTASSA
jgi:hypothetical protein